MSYIHVGQENNSDIELYFEDFGSGQPIVLIHGYPFSGTAWEKQIPILLEQGYRVITYDRRGFGRSSQPYEGYNYDTFASDLNILLRELKLEDVILVGHSMGTGEIARYLGNYGSKKIAAAIMVSPIPPFLLKTDNNPTGIEKKIFDGFKASIRDDRYAFMTTFLKNFYGLSPILPNPVSDEKLRADFNLGTSSSPIGFLKCVDTWIEDFRDDIKKIDVPLLVIQGDDDKILPIEATGEILTKEIGTLVKISSGSHGIPWTHADEVSGAILNFLREKKMTREKEQNRTQSDLH